MRLVCVYLLSQAPQYVDAFSSELCSSWFDVVFYVARSAPVGERAGGCFVSFLGDVSFSEQR